jgi:hypothetical protein
VKTAIETAAQWQIEQGLSIGLLAASCSLLAATGCELAADGCTLRLLAASCC